jgi:hypothetical protein
MKAGALTIVIAAIVAAGTLVGGSAGSAHVTTAPQWQTVPVDNYGIQFAVWAAGRLWIGSWGGSGDARMVSARVSSGRLTGWVTAKVSLGGFVSTFYNVLGEYLVYSATGADGVTPEVKGVKLLPNGKVSALTDLGGAPAAQSSGATFFAQLPDRVVAQATISAGRNGHHAGGCCDANGKVVDWNSFLPYGTFARFGVDRHGRLWLAWSRPGKPAASMVELDTATLQPKGKPATAPGQTNKIDEMVCAERCRLVIEGNYRDRRPNAHHFWSWAPGERSVTQIKAPRDYSPSQVPQLRGAHDQRGHLVVVFTSQDKNSGTVIALARGDVRGGNARIARSIVAPYSIGSKNDPSYYLATWGPGSGWGSGAAFGPNGFAAVAEYQDGKVAVRVAILPL